MQWPSALCYASYEEKREGRERRDNIHTFEKTWQLKVTQAVWRSGGSQREEWTHDTYHIWQGYSVLGNYQSDVKGGFDRWLVPAGESSASIRGLEGGRERMDTNWDPVCSIQMSSDCVRVQVEVDCILKCILKMSPRLLWSYFTCPVTFDFIWEFTVTAKHTLALRHTGTEDWRRVCAYKLQLHSKNMLDQRWKQNW